MDRKTEDQKIAAEIARLPSVDTITRQFMASASGFLYAYGLQTAGARYELLSRLAESALDLQTTLADSLEMIDLVERIDDRALLGWEPEGGES